MSGKNPRIGEIECRDCDGVAVVKQAGRRGNHFYTDCPGCGINQATGAARQQMIWDNARFDAGATVKRPNNVSDKGPAPVNEPVQTEKPTDAPTGPAIEQQPAQPAEQTDFDPTETEPETDAPTDAPPSLARKLLPGLILVGAGIAGALWG